MDISFTRRTVTAAAAHAAVEAAVAHGRAIGRAMVAVVVDASGDPVALLRDDGAFKTSITVAQDKAFTAAVFGASTDEVNARVSSSPTLHHGIASRPGVVLFGGGFPIVQDGAVIGGIGVSGGSEDDDRGCAKAGLAALGLS